MNIATCPYCGGNSVPRFTVGDVNRRISNEQFEYCECPSCGLLFLNAPPQDLGRYYAADYYYIPRDAAELARCAEPERYKIDMVQRFMAQGSLVEIGPSSGCFSYLAKRAGFAVTAIEMSQACCVFLRDVVGVAAIQADDEIAALGGVSDADVIALWQVIEHLRAPWELIRVAAGKLKPGGILVIAAPNPAALQFRLLGRRWVHVDAPRHTTLPSADFIAAVAAQHGLKTQLVTTQDPGSLSWNKFGWSVFCANYFSGRFAQRVARRVGHLIAWLMTPLESRAGAGCAYTIVLKKDAA